MNLIIEGCGIHHVICMWSHFVLISDLLYVSLIEVFVENIYHQFLPEYLIHQKDQTKTGI